MAGVGEPAGEEARPDPLGDAAGCTIIAPSGT